MSQGFPDVDTGDTLTDSRSPLLERDDTLLSNSAGTSFPTDNLVVGRFCYRTDQAKLYKCTSLGPTVWSMVHDFNKTPMQQEDAEALFLALTDGAAGLDFDNSGNGFSATDVQEAIEEARDTKKTVSDLATVAGSADKLIGYTTGTGVPEATKVQNRHIDAGAIQRQKLYNFAPAAQTSPNMTIKVGAGIIVSSGLPSVVAQQNTATITAPSTNPRKDIVSRDPSDGSLTVTQGTEDPSPTDPALPSGHIPIARLNLTAGMTEITSSNIEDIRIAPMGGRLANKDAVDTVDIEDGAVTTGKMASGASVDKWDGAAKTVSTSDPSGGADGDFWFKYEV